MSEGRPTAEDVALMRRLYLAGHSQREVERITGWSKGAIYRRLRDIARPKGRERIYSDEVRRKVCELYAQGHTIREVAKIIGIARGTVHLWIGQEGVAARIPGRRANLDYKQAQAMLDAGERASVIAARFGVGRSAVCHAIARGTLTRSAA